MRLHSRFLFCVAAKSALAIFVFFFCRFTHGQILSQDQEIRVHDLPMLTAKSHDPSDVLLASLETILHDKEICCGKDSALEDSLAAADPKSLQDINARIEGRHLLSDGRPIQVETIYLTAAMVNGPNMIHQVLKQSASLIQWNSHLYVLHGVVFVWDSDSGGNSVTVIHKLLLWDLRYADSRREVVFTRGVDDAAKVEGVLFAKVSN